MSIDIKVPSPGESITEVEIAEWLVDDGAYVEKDQDIVEIDSDKATLSIPSPESGKIKRIAKEGDTIEVGGVIASLDTSAEGKPAKEEQPSESAKEEERKQPEKTEPEKTAQAEEKDSQPAPADTELKEQKAQETPQELNMSPLARKLLQENHLSEEEFIGLIKKHRIGKKDVEYFTKSKGDQDETGSSEGGLTAWGGTRDEERQKLSTLRRKLAQRLVAVKNETAMLTTFNEVNMTPIMEIRKKYKDKFKDNHGVSLGFMSFFTKAVTQALNLVPGVNARLDGSEIVYYDYADIGIAVSSPKGLMVPVLRNAEKMTLAEIERTIKELAEKARTNKITIDEMSGGTFTITNGGVFGSMLSTPIINPPQSAILGMHNIVERPVAVNGKVEIHPVMYVALSYDHRIIDGSESVTFLVNVKKMLEEPANMLFGGKNTDEALLGL